VGLLPCFSQHSSRARQYTGTYSAFCGGVFYNSHYTYRCFQFCTSICKRWIASYIRRILDSCGGTHTETAVIARLLCGQSSVDQGPDFTKIAGTVGPDSEIAYCSCYTVKYLTFCGGVPIGTAQHTGFYSAFCGGATSNFTQTNRSSLLLYLAIIQVAADHRLLISEAQTSGTTTDCWRTYNPGHTEQLLTFCGGVSFISQVFVPQPIQHTDLYTAFCGGAIIHLHNFTGSFLCFKFDTNWIDREYTADCETDTVHIQAFCGGASTQSRPCSTLCTAVFALNITEPQQHWFGHCFEQDQTAERLTLGSLQRLQPLNCYWNLSVTALIWTGIAFLLTLIYNINTIARLLLANEALEFESAFWEFFWLILFVIWDTGISAFLHFHSESAGKKTTTERVHCLSDKSDCCPGPKSGHSWLPSIPRLLRICLVTLVLMNIPARNGGEGDGSVMRPIETSQSVLPQVCCLPDVKRHDKRPPAGSISQSTCLTAVKKRSLKRAHRRACQQGLAWYKGRLYRPEDFSFMPPVEPMIIPPCTAQADTQQCHNSVPSCSWLQAPSDMSSVECRWAIQSQAGRN